MNRTGVMIVYNDIVRDNRVLKMASAMRRVFSDFTLIGTYQSWDMEAQPKPTVINGLNCLLFPNCAKSFEADTSLPRDEYVAIRHMAGVEKLTREIDDYIAERKPSCLHTHDMYTISAGAMAKRRSVAEGRDMHWIHDIHENARGAEHMPTTLQNFAITLEDKHVTTADTVLTVTQELAGRLKDAHEGLDNIEVIYNSPVFVQSSDKMSRTVRDDVGSPTGPIAVYLGQVKKLRGVERMVGALTHLPDWHYAILTTNKGKVIDSIKALSKSLGVSDRVHFLDYVPPDKIVRYIQSADLGVNPLQNYGNAEVALPNKLFDYVFAGLPVLSHNLEAPGNFFAVHDVGVCVDFDDHPRVANAAKELHGRSRKDMEDERRRVAESYSWEMQESRLCELYLDVLGFTDLTVVNRVKTLGLPESDLRVMQGITGAAGQPGVLSAKLDGFKGVTARSFQITLSKFGYGSDLFYPVKSTQPEEMAHVLACVADDFDLFHIHSRGFLFDRLTSSFLTGMDLLALRAADKKVIMHFRGTEVRLASEFKKFSPYNYVDDDEDSTVSKFPEDAQREYIALTNKICNRVLVNDPEIQSYVPGSIIIERALDAKEWPFVGLVNTEKPLIVHAPSRMGVKGTSHVIEAVEKLRADGLNFDFELVHDMSHSDARALYEKADIIVDQLRIGWYGVLSVEAMALGKPVVAYIREDLEHHLGPYPPLVTSTPDTISADLRRLILNPELREEYSRRGRDYFERVHDSDVVARKLLKIYREVEAESDAIDFVDVIDYLGAKAAREKLAHGRLVKAETDLRKALKDLKAENRTLLANASSGHGGGGFFKRARAPGDEDRLQFIKRKYATDGPFKATVYFAKRLIGIK